MLLLLVWLVYDINAHLTYNDGDDDDDDLAVADYTTVIIASSVISAVAVVALICAFQFIRQVPVSPVL